MLAEILRQFKEVPDYFYALKGAMAILASGVPLYLGLRYFSYRRNLSISFWATLNFLNVFILFAGLAFLLGSPLSAYMPPAAVTAYLFVTCIAASFSVVSLVDVFLLQHYLSNVKKAYVSPPLRAVIKVAIFCVALLPILRFVLHFNPLALVAIPTIATAGIALALQDTLKTFIAGVSLGNIIRLGQWISFQDKEGQVVDINWARTVLRSISGNYIYIPNTLLQTSQFVNYTVGELSNRMELKLGMSYDIPPARIKEILVDCLQGIKHIAATPKVFAAALDYGESSVQYGLYYWLDDYGQKLAVQDEVATRVWYAFRREGIEIPYPARNIFLHQPKEASAHKSETVAKGLQHWALAQAFYPEELSELSHFTRSHEYSAGETIVKQGDGGQSLFVIVQGSVEIWKAEQPNVPIASLKTGDLFGEMSLLTGEPRSATVRAAVPTEVLEIEKAGLQTILVRRPELSAKLANLVVQRQSAKPASAADGPSTPPDMAGKEKNLTSRIKLFFGL